MLKKILGLAAILAVVATIGLFYLKNDLDNYQTQILKIDEPTLFTLPSGTSLNRTLALLEKEQYITPHLTDRLLSRAEPDLISVKAGTYELTVGMTLKEALTHFVSGDEYHFSITFVEGSTYKEWMATLQSAPHLKQVATTMNEAEVAQHLDIPHSKLEGLFLAETYYYTAGMSDIKLLEIAHKKLKKILDKEWEEKETGLPLKSPYEALILASIIEKETAIPSERPVVSSVFINRLNKKMRLQTDPTVIYGMGDKYDGNIRKKDLRTPTPYNTYTINGLPPTPIAMVGKEAIEAALEPKKTKFLYFVASGEGGHVFSKTLREHNRAVRAYLKKLKNK